MIDLGRSAARELRKLGIRIDWRATFMEFCQVHGGLPVRFEGRLLFADGWQHGMDYRGPEYPPPKDPVRLRNLQLAYQRGKRLALKREIDWLEGIVGTFDEAQRLRSAPIQRAVRLDERDAMGNQKWTTEPVRDAVGFLRDRLIGTRHDLRECEAEIERLETVGAGEEVA